MKIIEISPSQCEEPVSKRLTGANQHCRKPKPLNSCLHKTLTAEFSLRSPVIDYKFTLLANFDVNMLNILASHG